MIRKYPKIQAFKNVCKLAHKLNITESVEYEGTVKLHGTNAAIVYDSYDNLVECQSRNNTITPENDNAGFAKFVHESLTLQYNFTRFPIPEKAKLVIYGEWCGKGIQKGVAISQLNRMFVIFDAVIKYDDNRPSENVFQHNLVQPLSTGINTENVFYITQFPIYRISVNFNYEVSKQAFAEYASKVTQEVGNKCPVAKHFGVSGLGEGIVWKPVNIDNPDLYIKTKDPKHSVTKVKTIVPLTEEQLAEKIKYEEFVNLTVTDNRINQAIQEEGADAQYIGNILRWIYHDITTEEKDLIETNNIEIKQLGKLIANKAKPKLLEILL